MLRLKIASKKVLALLGISLLIPAIGAAQSHGYGFIGGSMGDPPGGGFRYGLGGAWSIAPRVTAGGEIGGVRKHANGMIGSGNLGFHFREDPMGFDPFVTGGFSYARLHSANGFYVNLGAGANYWFRPRVAVRGEFRAYPGGGDLHSFSEIRFGVSFR